MEGKTNPKLAESFDQHSSGGAAWRGSPPRKSEYPTNMLFHVSDGHGRTGLLPFFAAGETWQTLHDTLHEARDFGGKEEHTHG